MEKKETIGAIVLICLFSIFGVALFFTMDRPSGPSRGIENNVIIEQRMKNNADR